MPKNSWPASAMTCWGRISGRYIRHYDSEFDGCTGKEREQASAYSPLTIRTMTDGMKSMPIRQKKVLRFISGMRPNASGIMNNYKEASSVFVFWPIPSPRSYGSSMTPVAVFISTSSGRTTPAYPWTPSRRKTLPKASFTRTTKRRPCANGGGLSGRPGVQQRTPDTFGIRGIPLVHGARNALPRSGFRKNRAMVRHVDRRP